MVNKLESHAIATSNQICSILAIPAPRELVREEEQDFFRFATRERSVVQGSLFIGQPPARQVQRLVSKGVTAFLAPAPVQDSEGITYPTFVHPDPAEGYRQLIQWKRKTHSMKVVAVTGSLGKTTVKDMIASAARGEFKTFASVGNNNLPGNVARHIQRLENDTEVFIQETGASFSGTVRRSAALLEPDMFVITSIGFNHVGDYGDDRDALLNDKLSYNDLSKKDATAFINFDDPILRGTEFSRDVVWYSAEDPRADYYAKGIVLDDAHIHFDVVERSTGIVAPVELQTHGVHNVGNAVVAYAVSRFLGMDPTSAAKGLGTYAAQGTRQNLTQLGSNRVLVDCYNASEDSIASTSDALATLRVGPNGKRLLVLGDIDDKLGALTEEIHRRVGARLSHLEGVDLMASFGPHMRYTAEESEAQGRPIFHTTDRQELTEFLRKNLDSGDVLAFKGGQQTALAATIDTLFGSEFIFADGYERRRRSQPFPTPDADYIIFSGYGGVLRKMTNADLHSLDIASEVGGHPVLMLARYSFSRSNLTDISIPAPVQTLGTGSFFRCRRLRTVSLPQTLKWIGLGAFRGCRALKIVNVPEGVTNIEGRAFQECSNLQQVTLPRTLQVLGDDAFEGCPDVRVRVASGSSLAKRVRSMVPEDHVEEYR